MRTNDWPVPTPPAWKSECILEHNWHLSKGWHFYLLLRVGRSGGTKAWRSCPESQSASQNTPRQGSWLGLVPVWTKKSLKSKSDPHPCLVLDVVQLCAWWGDSPALGELQSAVKCVLTELPPGLQGEDSASTGNNFGIKHRKGLSTPFFFPTWKLIYCIVKGCWWKRDWFLSDLRHL